MKFRCGWLQWPNNICHSLDCAFLWVWFIFRKVLPKWLKHRWHRLSDFYDNRTLSEGRKKSSINFSKGSECPLSSLGWTVFLWPDWWNYEASSLVHLSSYVHSWNWSGLMFFWSMKSWSEGRGMVPTRNFLERNRGWKRSLPVAAWMGGKLEGERTHAYYMTEYLWCPPETIKILFANVLSLFSC